MTLSLGQYIQTFYCKFWCVAFHSEMHSNSFLFRLFGLWFYVPSCWDAWPNQTSLTKQLTSTWSGSNSRPLDLQSVSLSIELVNGKTKTRGPSGPESHTWVLLKAYIQVAVERWLCPWWHLGWGQFWPKGHNLNKHGIGPLGHATYQIPRL